MTASSTDYNLRINGIVEESIVDGPGIRFVVFTQGCPHRCPGCHNPQTHAYTGGRVVTPAQLLESTRRNPLLRGVTLSGGEPFYQAQPLAEFARLAHTRGLDVITYTGYTLEQLQAGADPGVHALLAQTDILIDGPFILAERDLSLRLRGSRNQRVIDMNATRAAGRVVLAAL